MQCRIAAATAAFLLICEPSAARTEFEPDPTAVVPLGHTEEIRLEARSGVSPGTAELRAGEWSVRCLRRGLLLAVIRMTDQARVMEVQGMEIPMCVDVDAGPDELVKLLERVSSLGKGYAVLVASNGDASSLLGDRDIAVALSQLGGAPSASRPYALIGATQLPGGYGFEKASGATQNTVAAVMVGGGLFEVVPTADRALAREGDRAAEWVAEGP